jgi:hypothetical protein
LKPISNRVPSALLIAEGIQTPSRLAMRLRRQGCWCSFARSYGEACSSVRSQNFDLMLSPLRLRGVTLFPLVDLLEGSKITLFYSHPVEQGCWWLPALRRGKKCFGSVAFRSSEFVSALDEVIAQIRMESHVMGDVQQLSLTALSVLEMPLRNEPTSLTPVHERGSELARQTHESARSA